MLLGILAPCLANIGLTAVIKPCNHASRCSNIFDMAMLPSFADVQVRLNELFGSVRISSAQANVFGETKTVSGSCSDGSRLPRSYSRDREASGGVAFVNRVFAGTFRGRPRRTGSEAAGSCSRPAIQRFRDWTL